MIYAYVDYIVGSCSLTSVFSSLGYLDFGRKNYLVEGNFIYTFNPKSVSMIGKIWTLLLALLLVGPSAHCQIDRSYLVLKNITPAGSDDVKMEKLSVSGAGDIYVLMNDKGRQIIGLFVHDHWFRISPPHEDLHILEIAAISGGVYALEQGAGGENSVYKWNGDGWKKMSHKKLSGTVKMLVTNLRGELVVAGSLESKGRMYHEAIHNFYKEWAFAELDEAEKVDTLFAQTEVIRLFSGVGSAFFLLKGSDNSKYTLVEYNNNEWKRLGANLPGEILSLIETNSGVYVLGKTDGSGQPFLWQWNQIDWKPVNIDASVVPSPEFLAANTVDGLLMAGKATGEPNYMINALKDNKWGRGRRVPDHLTAMVSNSTSTYMLASPGKPGIFVLVLNLEKVSENQPAITEDATGTPSSIKSELEKKEWMKEREKRAAEDRKELYTVKEVYNAYRVANERVHGSSMFAWNRFMSSTNEQRKKNIDDVSRECNEILATVIYRYKSKLDLLNNLSKEDTKFRSVFVDYLKARIDHLNEINSLVSYLKNGGGDRKALDSYLKSIEFKMNVCNQKIGLLNVEIRAADNRR